jgi:hypothetical protein
MPTGVGGGDGGEKIVGFTVKGLHFASVRNGCASYNQIIAVFIIEARPIFFTFSLGSHASLFIEILQVYSLLLGIHVLWDWPLCCWVSASRRLEETQSLLSSTFL